MRPDRLHFVPGTGAVLGGRRGLTLLPALCIRPSHLLYPSLACPGEVLRLPLRPGVVRFHRPLVVRGLTGRLVWRFFRTTGRWEAA